MARLILWLFLSPHSETAGPIEMLPRFLTPSCNRTVVCIVLIGMTAICHAQDKAGQSDLDSESAAIRKVVEQASSSVVRLDLVGGVTNATSPPTTSGTIISTDGLVVTSLCGMDNTTVSPLATLNSGERVTTTILCRDFNRNLALLKLNVDRQFDCVAVKPKADFHVGQRTIALGKTLLPDRASVSIGVVSATDRIWGKAMQTDAKISPLNYGGPLLDLDGRAFGILTPLDLTQDSPSSGVQWYDSGIGFAVPLEDVLNNLDRMKATEELRSGKLGVFFGSQDFNHGPVEVSACVSNSAVEAGLHPGDQIVQVNGARIERLSQLRRALGPLYAGDVADIVVKRRSDAERTIHVPLQATIEPYIHRWIGIIPESQSESLTIAQVVPDSPASRAALQPGDKITAIGDVAIGSRQDFARAYQAFRLELLARLMWNATASRTRRAFELKDFQRRCPQLARSQRSMRIQIANWKRSDSPGTPITFTPSSPRKPIPGIVDCCCGRRSRATRSDTT